MELKKIVLAMMGIPLGMSAAMAQTSTILSETVVTGTRLGNENATLVNGTTVQGSALDSLRTGTNDAARLLEGTPGMSFYSGGGVSSLPVVDGLADDRLRLLVNGMTITSACPNHMNPALSYLDPSAVQSISVIAGITPVSLGGDSIGGTIVIRSADPVFANAGEGTRTSGSLGAFYRSNGNVSGVNARASLASENFSINYTGSTVRAGNYKDGDGRIVRSTEYESRNNLLTLATRFGADLFSLDIGWQDIPSQGYPNQYMDMTSNKSLSFNGRYKGLFDWGQLEARAYRQAVRHKMDMLEDKANLGVLTSGTAYTMPMDTKAADSGYSLQAEIKLSPRDLLRLGHEYHHYTLDDWWPPIAGYEYMMGPDTFWNINGGKRDRLAFYGEWEAKWSPAWTSQLGVRYERVSMNTGNVQGYYSNNDLMGMYPDGFIYQNDANAFNAADHKKVDNNIDWTASTRYEASSNATYDFGLARKTRSPNIYERFAWSNEAGMAGAMNNWFGDLNAYVGNLNLKPEVAHTLRATADWHDAERRDWAVRATPFFTRVNDYINVEPNLSTTYSAPTGRTALRFVNHDARLYGLDLGASKYLGRAGGEWTGRVVLNYVRGKDLDSGNNLYNIMPLNARLALDLNLGAWSSSIEVLGVTAKNKVDAVRLEQKTSAYSLVNLRTSYTWGKLRVDAGIDNLFDKSYALPLGGLDFYQYNYLSPTTGGHLATVRGAGRSLNAGLTLSF